MAHRTDYRPATLPGEKSRVQLAACALTPTGNPLLPFKIPVLRQCVLALVESINFKHWKLGTVGASTVRVSLSSNPPSYHSGNQRDRVVRGNAPDVDWQAYRPRSSSDVTQLTWTIDYTTLR